MQIHKIILKISILCSTVLAYAQVLSMPDAIELLKRHNPQVRISHEKQLLAQKAENNFNARYIPKIHPLQFHYDAVCQKPDVTLRSEWKLATGGTLNLHYHQTYQKSPKANITLEQPITHNTAHAQDNIKALDIKITQLQEQEQYESIILKLRKSYYQCVLDQLLLDHQKTKLSDIQQALQRYSILYQGGEISKLEFEKALNQQERTSIDYLKNEQAAALHLTELKNLLGLPLHQHLELDTHITHTMMKPSLNTSIQKALTHNIAYQRSKLQFEKAKHAYEIAKKQGMPQLSVYAKANEEQDFNAGIRLQIALPDSDVDYQHTKMTLDYHHAQQLYADQEMALKMQVQQLLTSLENQEKLIELSNKNLKLQQSIYNAEIIKSKYLQISPEDLQKASDQLQQAYQESIKTQIEFSHLRDQFLQLIGEFSMIIQPEKSHV